MKTPSPAMCMKNAFDAIVLFLAVLVFLGGCVRLGTGKSEGADRQGKAVAVAVAPPDGPALPLARLLAVAVARGLTDRGIPANALKNADDPTPGASYVLSGRAWRNLDDPKIPYTVLIRWTLRDRRGEKIESVVRGVVAPWRQWEYGDPKLIRFVGGDVARSVSSMIAARHKAVLPRDPLSKGFLFSGVLGAPGDGNKTLGAAMRAALLGQDVLLTSDPRQAAFRVDGHVRVKRLGAHDHVTITWRVRTVAGARVGDAVQENTVPAGSLDGTWSAVAPTIARAGALGIVHIFAPSEPVVETQDASPPVIPLRAVPGRAPPPPQ